MKIVCAWCGKEMGTKDGEGQAGTTHGICSGCLEQQLRFSRGSCVLKYAEAMKRSLNEVDAGWLRDEVWCPLHQEYHELTPDAGQRPLLPGMNMPMAPNKSSRRRVRFLPWGLPCFHKSTSDMLTAPCAYCGTTLHAHKDMLAGVKSGRLDAGYLEEKCPACHRVNAVLPTYGETAISTLRLVECVPAMQLKLKLSRR